MDEVEEIKHRLDIADVVGSYIQLKQAGRNRKGVCPFHSEKTPSFMVSPEKGIWHCFGCEQGGDVISFVMKIEGIEFRDALEMLAKKAGVELKQNPGAGKTAELKKRLYAATELAVRYYQATLVKNNAALEYLIKQRGISKDTIKTFQIGYAPDDWEALTKFLISKKFTPEELSKAGLASKGTRGLRDMFRARIMLPVCDAQGRPVGFSARLFKDTEGPKYLNTPDTMLYNKSHLIYGWHLAKDAVREADEAVFVEGNLDVIASHQAGLKQVVASSGTALTHDQLRVVSRLTKNVKLAFDQDKAGLAATERAIELAGKLNLVVKVIETGEAKDPDELIKKDPKLWAKAVADAKYAMDYLLNKYQAEADISSAMGKKQFSDRMAQVIGRLSDPVERDHYAKLVADVAGVSQDAVNKKIVPSAAPTEENDTNLPESKTTLVQIEESFLALLLAFPDTRLGLEHLRSSLFSSPNRQEVWKSIVALPNDSLDQIAKALPGEADYVKILGLRGEEEFQTTAPAARSLEAYNLARRLQDIVTKNLKHKLSEKLKLAEQSGDSESRHALLEQYQQLIRGDY